MEAGEKAGKWSKRLGAVAMAADHEVDIDFANIALYVPAIQLIATLIAASSGLLLFGWVMQGDGCAIRSASLCTFVCAAGLWRKIRMHYARGADGVFDALRPAAVIWLVSIVAEHLVGACAHQLPAAAADQERPYAFSRNAIFHLCMVAMMCSGLVRAWAPDSENDYPFAVSAVALVVIAMVPPAVQPNDHGPLCETSNGYEVGERYLRTVMFGLTYTCLVYAAPPMRYGTSDVVLCVCRAAAGSIWTLGCVVHMLIVAPVQCAMIIWLRVSSGGAARAVTPHGLGADDDCSPMGDERHNSNNSDACSNVSATETDELLQRAFPQHNGLPYTGNSPMDYSNRFELMAGRFANGTNGTNGGGVAVADAKETADRKRERMAEVARKLAEGAPV